MGDEDSKACAFELAGEELKQKSVHEHAARERDGVDALVHADIAGDARRGARDGNMEVECEPVGGRSGFSSSQKCLKECFLIQNMGAVQPRWARCEMAGVVVGKMGDFVVERAPGGSLKFDGGFALVGCLVADAQNCCRGIKETPHAAGTRAVDAALDHGGCHAARLLAEAVQKPSGTWVLEQAELTEQGKGVAAGVAHGGRPTGERPGAQMRGALKAAKAGNKKLAAPNGPIGAGAGAVKGDAKDARVGCKLARGDGLGHYARDMCMMVLHLDERQIAFSRLLARPLAR